MHSIIDQLIYSLWNVFFRSVIHSHSSYDFIILNSIKDLWKLGRHIVDIFKRGLILYHIGIIGLGSLSMVYGREWGCLVVWVSKVIADSWVIYEWCWSCWLVLVHVLRIFKISSRSTHSGRWWTIPFNVWLTLTHVIVHIWHLHQVWWRWNVVWIARIHFII